MAGQASEAGRLTARELLSLIHGLAGYDGSLLQRKLRGPMAAWNVEALLLRQVLLAVQGGNWQRSGGKGNKPKPIELPGEKKTKQSGPDVVQRLRNLGHIPPGT